MYPFLGEFALAERKLLHVWANEFTAVQQRKVELISRGLNSNK